MLHLRGGAAQQLAGCQLQRRLVGGHVGGQLLPDRDLHVLGAALVLCLQVQDVVDASDDLLL
jgi:hypothetical protein